MYMDSRGLQMIQHDDIITDMFLNTEKVQASNRVYNISSDRGIYRSSILMIDHCSPYAILCGNSNW